MTPTIAALIVTFSGLLGTVLAGRHSLWWTACLALGAWMTAILMMALP